MKEKYLIAVFVTFLYITSNCQIMVNVEELSTFPDDVRYSIPAYKTVNNKMYFFGGFYNLKSYQCSDKIWLYDLQSNEWEELPFNLPYEIGDFYSATYFNNHFYISPGWTTGNYNGWGSHNKMIDVDLSNSIASETLSFSTGNIWNIANIEISGKIYFIGGHTGSDQNKIWEYNIETNNLPIVAYLQYSRNDPALISGNDEWIYILGDHESQIPIERFNPVTYEVEEMHGNIPISEIYYCWHIPSSSSIYFFTHNTLNAELFEYNYLLDSVESTGYFVNQPFFGRSTFDQNSENIIYALKPDDDNFQQFTLCKLTLENYSSINENYSDDLLIISPNPVVSKTTMEFPNPNHSNYKLSVFNISGNKVFEMDNIHSDKIEFNKGNLSQGIYFIELKGEKVVMNKKIIIK